MKINHAELTIDNIPIKQQCRVMPKDKESHQYLLISLCKVVSDPLPLLLCLFKADFVRVSLFRHSQNTSPSDMRNHAASPCGDLGTNHSIIIINSFVYVSKLLTIQERNQMFYL